VRRTSHTIGSVILWSVISAAFIGPGTVTTAVSAGAQYKFQLLWAVVFATIACIVLQEIAARLVIATDMTLGQLLVKKFGQGQGAILQLVIGGTVVFGCAAYEAGNILGAVSGLTLLIPLDGKILTVLICLVSFLVLWFGGKQWISQLMIALVLIMGVAFVALAASQPADGATVLRGSAIPMIPAGSDLIVLGLIGTTIVPYNIFIGSGISHGQTIPLMRIGLGVSVAIGGLITAAIVWAGTTVDSFSSFEALAAVFMNQVGVFAAGFSSAITSPYAASVVATTVFGFQKKWQIRVLWGVVLLTGFFFGISGIKPVPVIVTVQALNGLILPLLVVYLTIIINDHRLIGQSFRHAAWYNTVLFGILLVVLVIGLNNVDKAVSTALGIGAGHTVFILTAAGLILTYTLVRVMQGRRINRTEE
jgi:manganese transport protein